MMRYAPSTIALIVANTVPLLGVLFFSWNVFAILLVYWLENAVIGCFNILKLRKATAATTQEEIAELKKYRASYSTFRSKGTVVITPERLSGGALIRFFVMHYGVFMLAHAIFLAVIVWEGMRDAIQTPIESGHFFLSVMLSVASLVASHGVSYKLNFIGNKEYERISQARQMTEPYRRVVIMHLTIIFGTIAYFLLHSPPALMIVLVLVKITVDTLFHIREHKKFKRNEG